MKFQDGCKNLAGQEYYSGLIGCEFKWMDHQVTECYNNNFQHIPWEHGLLMDFTESCIGNEVRLALYSFHAVLHDLFLLSEVWLELNIYGGELPVWMLHAIISCFIVQSPSCDMFVVLVAGYGLGIPIWEGISVRDRNITSMNNLLNLLPCAKAIHFLIPLGTFQSAEMQSPQ